MPSRGAPLALLAACLLAPVRAGAAAADPSSNEATAARIKAMLNGSAVKGDPSIPQRLERIEREATGVREKAEVLLSQLTGLRKEYDAAPRVADLAPRREQIRLELTQRRDELLRLVHEYEAASRNLVLDVFAEVLSGIKRGRLTSQTNQAIDYGTYIDRFRGMLRDDVNRIESALAADEADHRAALKAEASKRLVKRALGGAAATLLLAGGLLAWRFRRSRPEAIRAGSPAALLGPGAAAQGEVLGGCYRVEGELGRGAMGVVFKALDLTLKRPVALKMLRHYAGGRAAAVDRFLEEARVVAGLKHPNIVQIHTAFKDGDDVYLVFEYVDGKPLSDVLADFERLPLPDAKRVVRQVAEALDCAHGQRIIHRDLKPSNIMIERDGAAKVMDFGLAHQAKLTSARYTHVENWGSPAYMAPEQELGTVSAASDIYALGACFYEMVTGAVPFPGPNELAQKQQMLFTSPSQLVAGLPAEIDAVLRRALHTQPEARFPNARDLAVAVESLPAAA